MRKIGLLAASLLLFSSAYCQQTVVVKNTTDFDRKAELVEVKTSTKPTKPFVLKNQKGKEISYQLTYNAKYELTGFIFQADVKANSSSVYTISSGAPASVKAKTFGRFVPERKDDFAWENDMAAYRMYGPALAKENPSNGVDFWAKRTDELVVDEFYTGELKQGLSYHRDRGHGLDFYKVAHTMGCGGIAPYLADSLWVGNHFDRYKVLENGSLRTVFSLIYDSVKVGNDFYKETITITAEAGSLLNKAVVRFSGKNQKMQLACGIFLHDGKGVLQQSVSKQSTDKSKIDQTGANAYLGYAEEAISDFKVPSGRNYVGVVNPTAIEVKRQNSHAFLLSNYKVGTDFTYYFGGGWNKWLYPTDEDWFKALKLFARIQKKPLQVSCK